ncbi:MAG: cytochrome c [Acidobacteriia bacterium]|nr:cytochrome c [Terriglobia bacterium]
MKNMLAGRRAEKTASQGMGATRLLAFSVVRFISLAAMAVTLLLVCFRVEAQKAGKPSPSVSAPAGNTEAGKKLFTTYGCYECHGRAAHGGVGPRLGPDAIPFAAFLQYVRHPAGTMPPYTAKVASDQDLADIYAFLKTLPPPPQAKNIPLLNQ